MGAWGTGIFENDRACDYAAGIVDSTDLSALEATLDEVLKIGTGYLEAPTAEDSLAAAAIIARLCGHTEETTAYTEELDEWVDQMKARPSKELISKAHAATQRVLQEQSELLELWQESKQFQEWKSSVETLSNYLLFVLSSR